MEVCKTVFAMIIHAFVRPQYRVVVLYVRSGQEASKSSSHPYGERPVQAFSV